MFWDLLGISIVALSISISIFLVMAGTALMRTSDVKMKIAELRREMFRKGMKK